MPENSPPQQQWSPSTGGIIGCAIAGAVLAVSAVTLATDAAGTLVAGLAGVCLLMFAGFSWRARPKLAVTPDGLAVRGWWRTRLLTRDAMARVRVTEFQRIGRTHRLLEIETTDDALLILSRWDLGADPREVFDALSAAGYTGGVR